MLKLTLVLAVIAVMGCAAVEKKPPPMISHEDGKMFITIKDCKYQYIAEGKHIIPIGECGARFAKKNGPLLVRGSEP